jgi:hypothetical protein
VAKPAPAGDTAPTAEQEPHPSFWRYIGHLMRVYMHIPVTVDHGDVIAHDGPPADDGHWEPHPGPATREPDNTFVPAPTVEE